MSVEQKISAAQARKMGYTIPTKNDTFYNSGCGCVLAIRKLPNNKFELKRYQEPGHA